MVRSGVLVHVFDAGCRLDGHLFPGSQCLRDQSQVSPVFHDFVHSFVRSFAICFVPRFRSVVHSAISFVRSAISFVRSTISFVRSTI